VPRLEGQRAGLEVAPHAESIEHALRQEHRWNDGRDRDRDSGPPFEAAGGQEHIVPVLQPKVDRFEQQPDDDRGPQHERQVARTGGERLAAQDLNHLIEDDESGVPREDVEPRGNGWNPVCEQQHGGDQDDRRRDESRPS